MSYSKAQWIDVKWRAVTDSDWVQRRMAAGAEIMITEGLVLGQTYEVAVAPVSATGQVGEWVHRTVTVPLSNRVGVAALPAAGNQASMWSMETEVTYAADDAEATVSMSTGKLIMADGVEITYGPSSVVIEGAPLQKKLIHLYIDDPWYVGGPLPLGVADVVTDTTGVPGRIAVGAVLIEFPDVGGSSSGGGSIGGGGGSGGAHRPNTDQQEQVLE